MINYDADVLAHSEMYEEKYLMYIYARKKFVI